MRTIIGAPPIAAIPLIRTASEAQAVVSSRRKLAVAVGAVTIIIAVYVQMQRSGAI
jgi:hypothetical protein